MWPLLQQNIRHVVRTKLLVVLLLFSFLIQYVGLRGLQFVTFRFQGVVSPISGENTLFMGLFFQLFTSAFIAAAYGIWMVPYAHQGVRSSLTFVLPVSKWKFPLSYALSMLVLLFLQYIVLFTSFGINFGFNTFLAADFPLRGVVLCLCLQTMAFEVLMFAFALSSLVIGQVPTFFLGALMIFLLQISGAVFRLDMDGTAAEALDSVRWARTLYRGLPPVGELVFDMRRVFLKPAWDRCHLVEWVVWLGVFIGLFRWKLRYPQKGKMGEA